MYDMRLLSMYARTGLRSLSPYGLYDDNLLCVPAFNVRARPTALGSFYNNMCIYIHTYTFISRIFAVVVWLVLMKLTLARVQIAITLVLPSTNQRQRYTYIHINTRTYEYV